MVTPIAFNVNPSTHPNNKLAPPDETAVPAAPVPQLTLFRTVLLTVVIVFVIVVPVIVGAYTIAVVLSAELYALLSVVRGSAGVLLRHVVANYPVTVWNAFVGIGLILLSVAVWCTTTFRIQVNYDVQQS